MTYMDKTNLSKVRAFRPALTLSRNNTTQKSLECGIISSLNLILSLNHSHDYLKTYTFTDYKTCAKNIKPLLCHILCDGNIPQDVIQSSAGLRHLGFTNVFFRKSGLKSLLQVPVLPTFF